VTASSSLRFPHVTVQELPRSNLVPVNRPFFAFFSLETYCPLYVALMPEPDLLRPLLFSITAHVRRDSSLRSFDPQRRQVPSASSNVPRYKSSDQHYGPFFFRSLSIAFRFFILSIRKSSWTCWIPRTATNRISYSPTGVRPFLSFFLAHPIPSRTWHPGTIVQAPHPTLTSTPILSHL